MDVETLARRLFAFVEIASDEEQIREKINRPDINLVVLDYDLYLPLESAKCFEIVDILSQARCPFVVTSSQTDPNLILESRNKGALDYIVKPYNQREFILRLYTAVQKRARISCIGGGTGLFNLLLGLKTLPNTLLTSIVSMSDDGGSSGKISQAYGILPPGDVRRSLVALSNAPDLMNQIMQYRFEKEGEFQGHSFGNIFLTVLAEVKGSMSEAVRALSDILNIQGIVIPASRTGTSLVARFADRTVIKGESKIDRGVGRSPDLRVEELWHEPPVACDADAYASIINSDIVTIGPGDLYTSIITNLVIKDLRDALIKTRATKIYICNLMTKPGETSHFKAADHIREVIKYLGGDFLDIILLSNTTLSNEAIGEYAKKDQSPVLPGDIHEIKQITGAEIIVADIGNETELVRHDSTKLKKEIQRIVDRTPLRRP